MRAGPSSSPLRQELLAATTLEGGKTLGLAEAKGQTHRWLVGDTGCLAWMPGALGGSQRPHPLSFQLWWLAEQPSGETNAQSPHQGPRDRAAGADACFSTKRPPSGEHWADGHCRVEPARHRPTLPSPHGCSCSRLLSALSAPCSERLAASGLGGPHTPSCSKRRDWRWRWLELIRASPCLLEQREFPSASKSPSPPSGLPARLFLRLSRHLCLRVQSCLTLRDLMHLPWDFPGKNSEVDCYFLLQRIFSIQGSNQRLLHWQADSLPQVPSGKPSQYFWDLTEVPEDL